MAESKKRPSLDVALLYGPTDDGKGARVLRARDGLLETGEVRPVKEGQPINRGEVVKLTPRADAPCVCDIEVLHQSTTTAATPQVSPGADVAKAALGEGGAARRRNMRSNETSFVAEGPINFH